MFVAQQLVAVLGRGVVDPDEPLLHADDLGATRGDGVFDAALVVRDENGCTVHHLEAHLARFADSAALLSLPAPDLAAWRELIGEATRAWDVPGEATLKLLWSRGRENSPAGPSGYLTITAVDPAAQARSRAGISVVTCVRGHASDAFADAPWLLGGVKSLSYAVNMAARRFAQAQGADDALFVSSDGFLLEGPTAGLIVALDDQLVTTPLGATGILPSVTVQVILDAAEAAGVGVRHELVRPEQLRSAQGAWLCSSIKGVLPLVSVDGRPLPHDAAITRTLAASAGF